MICGNQIKSATSQLMKKKHEGRKVWGIHSIKSSEQNLHEVQAILESNMTSGEENTYI
jgi:hypothetical protein